jgi:hypothetical protein
MYQHFRLKWFLGGLVLGLFLLYAYKAPPPIVYEYPHPQKGGDRVYRDRNGVCYSYTATKVDCDANEATLRPYPLQG